MIYRSSQSVYKRVIAGINVRSTTLYQRPCASQILHLSLACCHHNDLAIGIEVRQTKGSTITHSRLLSRSFLSAGLVVEVFTYTLVNQKNFWDDSTEYMLLQTNRLADMDSTDSQHVLLKT
jgi:hypothetical protein